MILILFVYVFGYPKYTCRTGDGSIFWSCICGCDAFLYLSYQKPSGRKIPGMADLPCAPGDVTPVLTVWECLSESIKWRRF